MAVDDATLLQGAQVAPHEAVGQGPLAGGEGRRQLVDVPGPARLVVVPRVVDLQEDPLRPLVEGHVGRGHAAARVVRQPQPP